MNLNKIYFKSFGISDKARMKYQQQKLHLLSYYYFNY